MKKILWGILIFIWRKLVAIINLPKPDKTEKPETPKPQPTQTPKPAPIPTGTGNLPPIPDIPLPKPREETKEETKKIGYDPMFLGKKVGLPKLSGRSSAPLDYLHFSILMNKSRRMPYYTAVNIDAIKYNKLKDKIPSRGDIGADNWIVDKRIDKADQLPKSFYSNNDFDLGHMVRREDALWGDTLEEAISANNDTFFLTNATPQHKDFNRSAERWKGLEDYALRNARKYDLRLSVFTGCIFKEDDRKVGSVQIPARFWKIIVMVKTDGNLSATGYIVHQDDLIKDITTPSFFVFEQFKTYQVTLKEIEAETRLSFGLNEFDPLQKSSKKGLIQNRPVAVESYSAIEF